jgi:hypothetical protein
MSKKEKKESKKVSAKILTEAIYETLEYSDINPFTKSMALEIADTVKHVIENRWEGKFVNGDFFLKIANGKYRSINSLRDLEV